LKADFNSLQKVCSPEEEKPETKAAGTTSAEATGEEDETEEEDATPAPTPPQPQARETPAEAASPAEDRLQPSDLRRSLAYSKLLLNVFGPNAQTATVTAQQYGQWCRDVGMLEECFGYAPGSLRSKRPGGGGGTGASTFGTGMGRLLS